MIRQIVALPTKSEFDIEVQMSRLFLQRALYLDNALRMGNAKHWRLDDSLPRAKCIVARAEFASGLGSQLSLQFKCDRSKVPSSLSAELAAVCVVASLAQVDNEISGFRVRTVEVMSDNTLRWSERGATKNEYRQQIKASANAQEWMTRMLEHLASV